MPTITDPFATAGELSIKSNGVIPAGAPDAVRALAAASRRIREYCKWHVFPQVSQTMTLNGPGPSYAPLLLPTLYLESITSITDDGAVMDLTQLEYAIHEQTDGVIDVTGGHCWTSKRGRVVATIIHGWPTMPDTLKDITLQLAARSLGSPLGATQEQAGGVSVRWSLSGPGHAAGGLLLDAEKADLDAYRMIGRT